MVSCLRNRLLWVPALAGLWSCGGKPKINQWWPSEGNTTASLQAERTMLQVSGGPYITGSTPEDVAKAYEDSQRTSGNNNARTAGLFDNENPRSDSTLPVFWLDLTPVTVKAYAEFVAATGRPAPFIDEAAWNAQRLVYPYSKVSAYLWPEGKPPETLLDHPVVLVNYEDGQAYCRWRGSLDGVERRLPRANEYEKAARGTNGQNYPYGENYDPSHGNDAVRGPMHTTSVLQFSESPGPYGHLDLSGNVKEWTSTPWPGAAGQFTVKGASWEDYAGVGRGAAQHGRDAAHKHIVLGFRCAGTAKPRN